ncbi:MAG TPA: hypothetical protein PKO33_13885 [Pyrinomonadaceae bacterium]|nr:hypothetical protein [Pyrinomonadaceae bacterium]
MRLCDLPVGARVLVRCRLDWRSGAISATREDKIVLTIYSPSGRTYRKSCSLETPLTYDGSLPLVGEGTWRETFVKYDVRW